MPFCPKCGHEVKEDDQFCSSCGNRIVINSRTEEISRSSAKKKKNSVISPVIVCILILGAVIGSVFSLKFNKQIPFSDDPEAIEKASSSVVLLECYDKDGNLYCTGSAFSAFEDGVFVTNYHVVEQEVYRITATTEDNTSFEIDTILAYDKDRDIAILKTKATPHILPLSVGESSNLSKGEKVVAIGSPLGLLNTVSTGVFSGYADNNGINEIQFTASISHGSSGGALFNDAGEVIGVTSASFVEGQNLNLAIPCGYVNEMFNKSEIEMSISDFYDTIDHEKDYSVDDVLQGKRFDDNAYVIGIVADIVGNKFYLVSKEEHVTKLQELKRNAPEEYEGPISWEKEMQSDYSGAMAKMELKEFRNNYSVLVRDWTNGEQIIKSINVGDVIRVKIVLSAGGISIYQKQAEHVSIVRRAE